MESQVMKERDRFRDALTEWFLENGRDYPWRRTREPYEVLVSEVMLQQTRIATVLGKGYYTRFLEAFPDVAALAAADDERLLKAWEGLGYYRRARMLRETARAVLADHGGIFPEDEAGLLALPGVGRYTAGALRAFAFERPAVVVDGNVARVLARMMDFHEAVDGPAGLRRIWGWAEELADAKRPAAYHAGLMELGQVFCRPGVPDCLSCPISAFCKCREPELLPVKKPRVAITNVDEHALWLRDGEGRLLLQKESGKRRTGLWKLPLRPPEAVVDLPVLADDCYAITRYRVRLRVHDGGRAGDGFDAGEGECWWGDEDLAGLAMAAPFRRAVERLMADF